MVISLAAGTSENLYLGTNDGHVFQSQDRGGHWNLRGRIGLRTDAVIAQMAASAMDSRRVFAAVWFREAGQGGGIFRSEDGGATWQPSGLQGEAVRAIEMAPSQPGTLVAGARSGVFRSTDEGRTWERISPPGDPELRNVDSVAVDPSDPALIYAGTYHLPWKTTDGGKTWVSVAAGLIDDSDIMSMRVDATNPARLYLSACSGIYRSENRGGQWTKLQGIPYAARRTQAIMQDPQQPATFYAATTEGLWVTRDAGESWERTTPKEWVVNGVAVLPGKGNISARVVIGTETQGVLVSEDSGKSFAPSNPGFLHQVVRQLVGDRRDPSRQLLVLERSGAELLESQDAGQNWNPLPPAAGKGALREWSRSRVEQVYASPWGWMAALSDATLWMAPGQDAGWQSWNASYAEHPPVKKGTGKPAAPRKVAVTARGLLAFSNTDAFLPARAGLLRCNRTGQCEVLPAFSKLTTLSTLWISPDGQLLAVASEGKLGISRDAGKSAFWRDLPTGIRTPSALLWDTRGNPTWFLATDRGLFISRDGSPWLLSQGGLPAGVVDHVWPSAAGLVVTLEQGGVYLSPDGTGSWTRLDQDAERSRMSGMVQTNARQLVFGSQSEGVLKWESPALP
jgi:photosystem II stability/assembly factor-like uncharacterized protein